MDGHLCRSVWADVSTKVPLPRADKKENQQAIVYCVSGTPLSILLLVLISFPPSCSQVEPSCDASALYVASFNPIKSFRGKMSQRYFFFLHFVENAPADVLWKDFNRFLL